MFPSTTLFIWYLVCLVVSFFFFLLSLYGYVIRTIPPKRLASNDEKFLWLIATTCLGNVFEFTMLLYATDSNFIRGSKKPLVYASVRQLGGQLLCDDASALPGVFPRQLDMVVTVLFWVVMYFHIAKLLWYLAIEMECISAIRNPFLPYNAQTSNTSLWIWVLPALYVLSIRYTSADSYCSLKAYHWSTRFPDILTVGIILLLSLYAWCFSRKLNFHLRKSTRFMMQRCARVMLVFIFILGALAIVYGVQWAHQQETLATVTILQCFVTVEPMCLYAMLQYDSSVRAKQRRLVDNVDIELCVRSNCMEDMLKFDLMKYMAKAIVSTIRQPTLEHTVSYSEDDSPYKTLEDLKEEDYARTTKTTYYVRGMQKSHCLRIFESAPDTFEQLRALNGISNEYYKASFDLDNIDVEKGWESSTGSVFFVTANNQFIVKTILRKEYETLLRIIPNYDRYITANSNSLLCRYLGCYATTLPVGSKKLYFVTMRNIFRHEEIHQRFDLNGSTYDRRSVGTSQMQNFVLASRHSRKVKRLLLDTDFLSIHRGLFDPSEKIKQQLQRNAMQDSFFLATNRIVHYSLLVGVHFITPNQNSNLKNKDHIVSKDGLRRYYLGIIDPLHAHTVPLRLHSLLHEYVFCKRARDMQYVSPNVFAQRFFQFLQKQLLSTTMSSLLGHSVGESSIKLEYDLVDSSPTSNYVPLQQWNESDKSKSSKEARDSFFI